MSDPMIDIIRAALGGDQGAVRALFAAISPAIQVSVANTLRRHIPASAHSRARHEVEDLTQEVFYALLANGGKRLRAWDPEKGLSIERYVRLVARHLVVSFLRKRERRVWEDDPEPDDGEADSAVSPERLTAHKELYAAVLAAVEAELSEQGRRVLHLLLIEGRSVAEVADALGISHNAVHVWQSRLKQAIEKALRRIVRGTPADE
jgi:RNA polymerase sigma-70 factor (ECF subfamily)